MEPDFKALAEAWVAGDLRLRGVASDRRQILIAKLAEALERRSNSFSASRSEEGLVVNIDRDHLGADGRLSDFAKERLLDFVEEAVSKEIGGPEA